MKCFKKDKCVSAFTLVDLVFAVVVCIILISLWFFVTASLINVEDAVSDKKEVYLEKARDAVVAINNAAVLLSLQKDMSAGEKLSLEEILQSGLIREYAINENEIIFPVVFNGKTILFYKITTDGVVPEIGSPYATILIIEP